MTTGYYGFLSIETDSRFRGSDAEFDGVAERLSSKGVVLGYVLAGQTQGGHSASWAKYFVRHV